MKSTMIPVFIFLINFRNETMLVKQKVMGVFEKNVKTCLENKKVYLMPYSRHGHFHLILILPVNMVELPQQHANIVHWLQVLPLPIVAKSSILNIAESLEPFFKLRHARKLVQFRLKISLFSYYFEMRPPLSKVIRFFGVTYYNLMKYFRLAFQTVATTILFLWIQSMIVRSQNYLQ